MCDFPYSNWICIASFSPGDLIKLGHKKRNFVRILTHMLHVYTLFMSLYGLCVFFTFRFLFWFFGSKSRESLVLSFGGKEWCIAINVFVWIIFLEYTTPLSISSFLSKSTFYHIMDFNFFVTESTYFYRMSFHNEYEIFHKIFIS